MLQRIHVVAAVLKHADGRILITQRPSGKSLAGAWEFPGGKVHEGETRRAALDRELYEELGITVETARPLIRYVYRYPDLEVELDAWRVARWQGEPRGQEGQAVGWYAPGELLETGLLPADAVIVNALRLPPVILVTPPEAPGGEQPFLDVLETAASDGRLGPAGLICLRLPDITPAALLELAAGAACRIDGTGARLLLHGDPEVLVPLLRDPPARLRPRLGDAIAGIHVPERCLAAFSARPVPSSMWFGVSCHSTAELDAACAAGADYVFLGNVLPTASHLGRLGLGWEGFSAMITDLPLPVYAIGGLGPEDLETAWAAGAQGIAAIRGLWPG